MTARRRWLSKFKDCLRFAAWNVDKDMSTYRVTLGNDCGKELNYDGNLDDKKDRKRAAREMRRLIKVLQEFVEEVER